MAIWSAEIKELENLMNFSKVNYLSWRRKLGILSKLMTQMLSCSIQEDVLKLL